MFSRHPSTMAGSKSEAMARMPISAASMAMPPVPQNGSRTVPPRLTPVRFTSALAYLGCRDIGEKNGLSPTLRFSRRSLSMTLSSMYRCTSSHSCMRTVTSGSRRSTWFFFERIPPMRRTIPWESASLIMPSKRFPRTANVPSGSSADSMFETSSGSYVPRYLPTLCVMPSLPATPSRAEGSKSATR